MDAYIYRAALWCPDCTREIKKELKKKGMAPEDPDDEYSYDSDDYPKGPEREGGGEGDVPQHCDGCGVFLENPLTSDGEQYVKDVVAEEHERRKKGRKPNPVTNKWEAFYDYLDFSDDEEDVRVELQYAADFLTKKDKEFLLANAERIARGKSAGDNLKLPSGPWVFFKWSGGLFKPKTIYAQSASGSTYATIRVERD
jgi:sarcosine oxidase delta subunit